MAMSLLQTAFVAALLAATATAACNDNGQQFNGASSLSSTSGQCVPSGYSDARDYGQVTVASLQSQCQAQCTSFGTKCQGYIAQVNKAADSGLMTGQCFFYGSLPTSTTPCADGKATLFGQAKDNTNQCFASSAGIASQFCSSYLAIPTSTVYTTTIRPSTTITSIVSTTQVQTTTSPTTTTTTIPTTSTNTFSTSTTYVTTATVTATFGMYGANGARRLMARAAATPACLNPQSVPASRISSACSCLSVQTKTISTASTAPLYMTTTTISVTSSTTSTVVTTVSTVTTTSTSTVSTVASASATSIVSTSTTVIVGPTQYVRNFGFEAGNLGEYNFGGGGDQNVISQPASAVADGTYGLKLSYSGPRSSINALFGGEILDRNQFYPDVTYLMSVLWNPGNNGCTKPTMYCGSPPIYAVQQALPDSAPDSKGFIKISYKCKNSNPRYWDIGINSVTCNNGGYAYFDDLSFMPIAG